MEYRKVGESGIEVSVIGLGCWSFGSTGPWEGQEDSESMEAVHAARDSGINLFDTAEGYGAGHSEEVLGKALKGDRDSVVIATKASRSNHAPEDLRSACEGSLKRLDTDYIDIYQLHWPSRKVDFSASLDMLQTLKKEGKVRVAGVSNFGVRDLIEITQSGRIEINQLPYSLLWRAIEFEITQECRKRNIGIFCYSPLAQGLLTGKFSSRDEIPEARRRVRYCREAIMPEVFRVLDKLSEICGQKGISLSHAAIGWLLKKKEVTTVLSGARNKQQAEDNANAADVVLDDGTEQQFDEITDKLKILLGDNPDMWKNRTESRYR